MKIKQVKICCNCKYYKKYYRKIKAELQIADCGECRNLSARVIKRVDEEETCEKWEEVQKPDSYDAESVIEEISDIICRLNVILYELNKIP